jgi:hypothetical protein
LLFFDTLHLSKLFFHLTQQYILAETKHQGKGCDERVKEKEVSDNRKQKKAERKGKKERGYVHTSLGCIQDI